MASIFRPLLVSAEAERRDALQRVLAALRTSLTESMTQEGESVTESESIHTDSSAEGQGPGVFEAQLAMTVRLSRSSPFQDVRQGCKHFLESVQQEYPDLPALQLPQDGPSRFITENLPYETYDEHQQVLLEDLFLRSGTVSHLERVMALHPKFSRRFWTTHRFIMQEAGPLLVPWRHYIAILAASRHQCEYLVQQQELEFLRHDGDKDWLRGVGHMPKKLELLLPLNALLAHQPWQLRREHVQVLLKGQEAWSVGELVHAILVMTSFHALASFVFSTGVQAEVDVGAFLKLLMPQALEDQKVSGQQWSPDGNTSGGSSGGSKNPSASSTVESVRPEPQRGALSGPSGPSGSSGVGQEEDVEALFDIPTDPNMIRLDTQQLIDKLGSRGDEDEEGQEEEEEVAKKRSFEEAGSEAFADQLEVNTKPSMCRYVQDSMLHTDFDVKSKEYSIFRAQDYSWKDHGYDLIDRFCEGAAGLLDEEFEYVIEMTDEMVGSVPNLDTTPFRRAIWYYTHRMKGVCHDDFSYAEVNRLLNRQIKHFLKKIVCYPETVSEAEWRGGFGLDVRAVEKCHVVFLAVEARKMAEILYGVRALSHHLYGEY